MTTDIPQALQDHLKDYSDELVFWLNGKQLRISNPDPGCLLVHYLHADGLTGTKIGCEQGGCGACTVMVSRRTTNGIDHRSINSCLKPIVSLAGAEVTTVEGIGNLHDGLDQVQHRIAIYNGTQCGFCTPGFVMNMHSYLQKNPSPTEQEIEDLFGGNLCRCTGYRPILHGMRTFACDYNSGKDCTQPCALDPFFDIKLREAPIKIDASKLPSPDEKVRLHFVNGATHWIRPATLAEVHELKSLLSEHYAPDQIKLVVGNTATGIYPHEKPRFIIDISHITELTELSESEKGIHAGAAVPIQDLMDFATKSIEKLPAQNSRGLRQFVEHAKHIAGIQVRNAGSVAGNIFITKAHTKGGEPFPSDLFTVLATLGTSVTILSSKYEGKRQSFELVDMPIAEDLPADAILESFNIPYTKEHEYVQTYRIARRPQMAHAVVNAGFRCSLTNDRRVSEISLIYAGLATCNGRLPETERWLKGKSWDEPTLRGALEVLRNEVEQIIVPMEEEGFTEQYRSSLAESFFYKFFLHVSAALDDKSVGALNASASEQPVRPLSSGLQTFEIDDMMLPLTSPIARRTAISQATGEVKYTHDMPLPPGGYYGELVTSTHAHAKFTYRDGLKATEEMLHREYPGFAGLVTVKDIPAKGRNLIGLGGDDPVFADGEVICVGSAICLVLADRQDTAKKIAEFVGNECIKYEDLPEDRLVRRSDRQAPCHAYGLRERAGSGQESN